MPRRDNVKSTLAERISSPEGKRRYVRSLFATIADRYDFITVALSYGQDRRWKRRLVRMLGAGRGARVLDLATGTGDIAFATAAGGADVVGLDVTLRMIQLARAKNGAGARAARFLVGDMVALPFPAASFDGVTVGYGLRNVPDLDLALDEISRVIKPGGRLVSLDFNRPSSRVIRSLYLWYLTAIGGALGWCLHGDPDTYRYIPASLRAYPGGERVAALIAAKGFSAVTHHPVLGGLMSIHEARRNG